MTDQDDTIRGLAALVRAALIGDRTAPACAERIASRAGLGEDDSAEAIEAALRKTLVRLDRQQLGTVLAALEDAADYRREYQDGDCNDCITERDNQQNWDSGVLCGDHESDEAMASAYDLLHEELQEHQGTGPAGEPQEDAAATAWKED